MEAQMTLGIDLKEEGQAKVDAAEDYKWRAMADSAIRTLARRGQEFTADDVRVQAGSPWHPNAMGARFSAARKAGLIRRVGTRMAERPSRHAAMLSVWVGR